MRLGAGGQYRENTDVVGLFPGRDEDEDAEGGWPGRDHQELLEEDIRRLSAVGD